MSDDEMQEAMARAFEQGHMNWYDEVEFYNYETGETTTSGKAIGHFTQVRK